MNGVDRRSHAVGVLDPGRGVVDDRPERPERRRRPLPIRETEGNSGGSGQGAPILTQLRERLDGRVGQLPLGRHLEVALVASGQDQEALVGLADDDRRAAVAPFEDRRPRVEPEPARLLGRGRGI